MSTFVTIAEAQARLKDLIADLGPDDHLVITENDRPVAEVRSMPDAKPIPQFGRGKGLLLHEVEDNEHMTDFQEYME